MRVKLGNRLTYKLEACAKVAYDWFSPSFDMTSLPSIIGNAYKKICFPLLAIGKHICLKSCLSGSLSMVRVSDLDLGVFEG